MMIKQLFNKLSKEDIELLKLSFFVSLILSIIIFIPAIFIKFWNYAWGPFIFVGNIASSIAYIKLANNIYNITSGYVNNPKRSAILNNLTTLLIYFIIFTISVLINKYTIFFCAFGVMIIKLIIVFKNFKIKKEGDRIG